MLEQFFRKRARTDVRTNVVRRNTGRINVVRINIVKNVVRTNVVRTNVVRTKVAVPKVLACVQVFSEFHSNNLDIKTSLSVFTRQVNKKTYYGGSTDSSFTIVIQPSEGSKLVCWSLSITHIWC